MLGVTVAAEESFSDSAPGFEADRKAYMSGMVLEDVVGRGGGWSVGGL